MEVDIFDFEILDIAETSAIAARCTGHNAKKVLIVFQSQENEAELQSFLAKVLAAAQLNLEQDVSLLIIKPGEKFSFIQLCQVFDIETLIAFGIPSPHLGIHLQIILYALVQHENRTYVFVDDLQQIFEERQQGGKRMSGELWQALKALFLN